MSRIFILLTLSLFAGSTLAHASPSMRAPASPSDDEYRTMLQIAQLKVNRINALRAQGNSNALSTSLVRSVLGRYYQVGDVWDVLSCKQKTNMAAMNGEAIKVKYHCGLFHYEVTEVKPGIESQVKIRVTQKEAYGLKTPDPQVRSIDLTLSDKFAEGQKLYHFQNTQTFSGSPNGVHTSISPLELYPLDVPDIYTAEQATATELPALPPEVQTVAAQLGYGADLNKSSWFEQQDLFGREIQVLWQRGDLWPTYLKTPVGIAILVRH